MLAFKSRPLSFFNIILLLYILSLTVAVSQGAAAKSSSGSVSSSHSVTSAKSTTKATSSSSSSSATSSSATSQTTTQSSTRSFHRNKASSTSSSSTSTPEPSSSTSSKHTTSSVSSSSSISASVGTTLDANATSASDVQRTSLVVTPNYIPTAQSQPSAAASSDSSTSSSVTPIAAVSTGFLHNKPAMAATFTILGLALAVAAVFVVTALVRVRRRRREEASEFVVGSESMRASGYGGLRTSYGTALNNPFSEKKAPTRFNQDNSMEDDTEATLNLGQMHHAPFDPFQNNYALPNDSIIPEPYRLSALEKAPHGERVSQNYAGQMQRNYGATFTPSLPSQMQSQLHNSPLARPESTYSQASQELHVIGTASDDAHSHGSHNTSYYLHHPYAQDSRGHAQHSHNERQTTTPTSSTRSAAYGSTKYGWAA